MPRIELVNVHKHVCRDVNLEIGDREIFVVVGTTGAGKTTLLNIMAGVTDYGGSVRIDGVRADSWSPKERGVGYLLQNLALFPHLDVISNIRFGLRAQGRQGNGADEVVSSLMDMMRIRHLARRYPHTLSGGEKKRVALARCLAPSPRILLLDEPTSSLDDQTAKYLRSELNGLLKKFGITTVYVTHDLREAEEIADRIALMNDGRIEQVSPPKDLFFSPVNETVSEFIGMPNIIECRRSRVLTSGLLEVVSDDLIMVLPYEGGHVSKIAVLPHDIYVADKKPPGPSVNRFRGVVRKIIRSGATVRLKVAVGGTTLLAEMPVGVFDEMSIGEGNEVYVVIRIRRLRYAES